MHVYMRIAASYYCFDFKRVPNLLIVSDNYRGANGYRFRFQLDTVMLSLSFLKVPIFFFRYYKLHSVRSRVCRPRCEWQVATTVMIHIILLLRMNIRTC